MRTAPESSQEALFVVDGSRRFIREVAWREEMNATPRGE